jgi:uncharacterized protein (DUF1330 family)
MTKAYWINTYRSIRDQQRVDDYIELARPAIKASGGRFVARGMPARAYEYGVVELAVIIEFDSVDAAVAAHDSPGYQAALEALGDGADRDLRIVEGLP